MSEEINVWKKENWPQRLFEIPEPPKKLYFRGTLPPDDYIYICIVGSRKYTPYGKSVCEHIIKGLAGLPIVVVSGLALGIDSIAHKAALDAGLHTMAFPGSGISDKVIYPRINFSLAKQILSTGSSIISEFESNEKAQPWFFPSRNRIMAGLSHLTLIIEATPKSGTLITARLALDYNREVGVVPGSIFSQSSQGPLALLKDGAHLITSAEDICDILNIKKSESIILGSLTKEEKEVLRHITYPHNRNELFEKINLPTNTIQSILMKLELQGLIKESNGFICQNI